MCPTKSDYQDRDRLVYNAGGGVWFRNSDETQIFVHVQLYPAERLWYEDDRGEQEITKADLAHNYHRLRL